MKTAFILAAAAAAFVLGAAEPQNLAANKVVTASSVQGASTPAAAAVDGKNNTRWSSQFKDAEWLQVDLGKKQKIGSLVIRWEGAFGKDFKIQLSDDGKTWKDVFTQKDGKGGVQTIKLPKQEDARYVRMFGMKRATQWGYSIWEMQIFEK